MISVPGILLKVVTDLPQFPGMEERTLAGAPSGVCLQGLGAVAAASGAASGPPLLVLSASCTDLPSVL